MFTKLSCVGQNQLLFASAHEFIMDSPVKFLSMSQENPQPLAAAHLSVTYICVVSLLQADLDTRIDWKDNKVHSKPEEANRKRLALVQ
jgi:hypothetical protein